MAYQQGYETNAQSMNGVVTITDGQGTIIQNGTITTNELDVNNLSASAPTQTCSLFANQTATGINIGNPSGATYVRSYWTPVSGYDVINYAYLTTTYYNNLLGLTNIWTGISNTFQNVIYVSLISPIGTILSLGSATNVTTSIQNGSALVVAQTPSSIVGVGSVTVNMADNGMRFFNTSGNAMIDFFSCVLGGNNSQSSRIRSFGGTSAQNSGALTIDSGSIAITSATGAMSITGLGTSVNSTGSLSLGTNTTTTALTIGNSSLDNTLIKNKNALIIGKNPETYVTATV